MTTFARFGQQQQRQRRKQTWRQTFASSFIRIVCSSLVICELRPGAVLLKASEAFHHLRQKRVKPLTEDQSNASTSRCVRKARFLFERKADEYILLAGGAGERS
uniref:Uncharacterized protein n=1 Tax=Tetraselmis sp. GSL018 TaxID=582737 RepID=A0A061R2T5_9CHLO